MSDVRKNLDIAWRAVASLSGALSTIEHLPAEVVGPEVNVGLLTPSQRAQRQVHEQAAADLGVARGELATAIDNFFPAVAQMLGEAPGGRAAHLWGGAGLPGQPMQCCPVPRACRMHALLCHDPGKHLID